MRGNASPPREVLVVHPLETAQLSTSLPGKHSPSEVKPRLVVVVVFWKSVDAPETRSAGSVASCSRDGGELEVDSDSHGLVLTSPDNLVNKKVTYRGLVTQKPRWCNCNTR